MKMNLPNKLSCFRMILVPIVMIMWLLPISLPVFNVGEVALPLKNIIALIIFGIASFTDYLDGHIARKNNLITSFGKFIDPIADKLLTTTMFILFAASGIIPVIPVIIMVWRDTIVDGLRMNTATKGVVVAAGILGKIKTVLQMITIILILLNNLPFALINIPMSNILLWISAAVSFVSGVDYFNKMKEHVLESM